MDGNSDLFCEAFLNLQTTAEGFSYAGKFGDAEDQLIGDVSNGNLIMTFGFNSNMRDRGLRAHFSGKGHEVVFT